MNRLERALTYPTEISVGARRRFARRTVTAPSGCVLLTGAVSGSGYPSITIAGQRFQAHRLAYVLARGPIGPELDVDHLCRNRRCIRVDHLEAVTHQVNIQRGFDARRPAVEIPA